MKKTMHVDDRLLAQARKACRAGSDTETVRLGLEALLREQAYRQLIALTGSEPTAPDVPRRRPSAGARARQAGARAGAVR